MKIRVNKSELIRIGNKLNSNADDLHLEIEKINNIINALAGYWEGKDRDRCVSVIKNTYLVNLNTVKKRIESYGNYLKEVSKIYDEVDNTYMKKRIK